VREDARVRTVLQRVTSAQVSVGDEVVGAIEGPGLLVLVGATHDDTPAHAAKLAAKVWGLRIFDDPAGGTAAVSAADVDAGLLVVSQFTLHADTSRGRRPSWSAAAPAEVAEPLVEEVVRALRALGARVATGRFGAYMQVSLVNDGPVTVIIDV
jgi:D-tyrosyl-tRNA(Tyr) deacylase